jgi:hypothetical protein
MIKQAVNGMAKDTDQHSCATRIMHAARHSVSKCLLFGQAKADHAEEICILLAEGMHKHVVHVHGGGNSPCEQRGQLQMLRKAICADPPVTLTWNARPL